MAAAFRIGNAFYGQTICGVFIGGKASSPTIVTDEAIISLLRKQGRCHGLTEIPHSSVEVKSTVKFSVGGAVPTSEDSDAEELEVGDLEEVEEEAPAPPPIPKKRRSKWGS